MTTVVEHGALEIAVGEAHVCARIDTDEDGTSEQVLCHGELGVLADVDRARDIPPAWDAIAALRVQLGGGVMHAREKVPGLLAWG